MTRADLLERCAAQDSATLLALIANQGGSITPALDSRARLQLARITYAGITGTGPGLIGAARDWRRQATRRVSS